jgi:DNA-binding protein HU-beta
MTINFGAARFLCEAPRSFQCFGPQGAVYHLPAGANTMTKSELIDTVAERMRQPKKLMAETIEFTFEQIAQAICENKRFCMPGFGTFSIRQRKARNGFNPRTNKKMKIPAFRTVGFRPAPELKKGL